MPCRRATRLTVTSGSCVSATIASFSAGVLRRRRSGPFRTSLFRLLLVIDTTLLLPLSEGGERVRSIKGPLHSGTLANYIRRQLTTSVDFTPALCASPRRANGGP